WPVRIRGRAVQPVPFLDTRDPRLHLVVRLLVIGCFSHTPEEAEKKWLHAAIEMLQLSQPAQSTTPKPEWLHAAIEMLRLSQPAQSTAPKPEMSEEDEESTPQEAEETVPLSPSAENTTHTKKEV
ncbi:hypothetical protein COCON_G00171660, partial [Conger conger]